MVLVQYKCIIRKLKLEINEMVKHFIEFNNGEAKVL